MNRIEVQPYYPAGGRVFEEVEITEVKATERGDVFFGKAITPSTAVAKNVIIYRRTFANNRVEFRTVSAKCPHQGADISKDALKADGNVYCSLHQRPICIFSEYNHAYPVEKRGERYFIVKNTL